jgi:hypothetical protein
MAVIWMGTGRFAPAYDTDAQSYITAVEAADTAAGQSGGLETAVKDAINAFVVGCKADGIWSAIKASCILAGARTLSGCLVPLVGTAPTNFNFVAGDYNRETGLVGNGSTKYLLTGTTSSVNINSNNNHAAVFASSTPVPSATTIVVGWGANASPAALSGLWYRPTNVWDAYNQNDLSAGGSASGPGFAGITRSASSNYLFRAPGAGTRTIVAASKTFAASPVTVFALGNTLGNPLSFSNARLAFYSIGQSLDLALLDARVTTLINAIAAAIP